MPKRALLFPQFPTTLSHCYQLVQCICLGFFLFTHYLQQPLLSLGDEEADLNMILMLYLGYKDKRWLWFMLLGDLVCAFSDLEPNMRLSQYAYSGTGPEDRNDIYFFKLSPHTFIYFSFLLSFFQMADKSCQCFFGFAAFSFISPAMCKSNGLLFLLNVFISKLFNSCAFFVWWEKRQISSSQKINCPQFEQNWTHSNHCYKK